MTEPFHDGHNDRLRELCKLIAMSRAQTQRLEELLAEELGESPDATYQRRRACIHLVRWVPGLAAGLVIVRKVLGDPRSLIATSAASTALVAGAMTFAVINTTPDYTTSNPAASAPALPPAGPNAPHARAPKRRRRPTPSGPIAFPRRAPGVTPTPAPTVAVPGIPSVSPPSVSTPPGMPGTLDLKHKPHKPHKSHRPKSKPTEKPTCRSNLPVLGLCLPLGRLLPS